MGLISEQTGMLPRPLVALAVYLALGGASAYVLSKWSGWMVGETAELEALLVTVLFIVALTATCFTAVLFNHSPRL